MALDHNFFVLSFVPNDDSPTVTDLVVLERNGNVSQRYYSKTRQDNEWTIYDPLAAIPLATVSITSPKQRIVKLLNPEKKVETKVISAMWWSRGFEWEGYLFVISRDVRARNFSIVLDRKPDPNWDIAKYKVGAVNQLHIYHHQINRISLKDPKGLEVAMIAALCSFIDTSNEEDPSRKNSTPSPNLVPADVPGAKTSDKPPGPINELLINEWTSNDTAVADCLRLLEDRNMLFVKLMAASAGSAQKIVAIAAEVKRTRKMKNSEDLFQYIHNPDPSDAKPNARPSSSKGTDSYKPPEELTMYLSRTPMPELEPKAKAKAKPKPSLPPAPTPKPSTSASTSTPTTPAGNSGRPSNVRPRPSSPPAASGGLFGGAAGKWLGRRTDK